MAHTAPAVPALTFQSTTFNVVDRNGQPWLRSPQIAEALGYSQANRIADLYNRNAAEFTDSMTALVKLPTAGGVQEVRIFSLRGAHLLGMFARTKVAAEFRRWVLDVLDAQVQSELSGQSGEFITAAQAGELATLIAGRFPEGKDRPYAWGRCMMRLTASRPRSYSAPVQKWTEPKNSQSKRPIRARQTCGFFAPGHPVMAGRAVNKIPGNGESARLACSRFLASRPPCRMRLRTFRQGHSRLSKERSMPQSIQVAIGANIIRQIDSLYSLNDLHRAAGGEARHQPGKFTSLEQTKALIAELGNSPDSESLKITAGRNGGTYACKELVIAYAAWISAAFHLKVIRAFLSASAPQQHPASSPKLAALPAVALDYFDAIRAGEKNPRVNDIPEDVLAGVVINMLMNNRWLTTFDPFSGRVSTTRIDPRAGMVTPEQLPEVIRESLSLSIKTLFDIQAACHERLRSKFEALEEKTLGRKRETRRKTCN